MPTTTRTTTERIAHAPSRAFPPVFDLNQCDPIHAAACQRQIAVACDRHVAHDAAARWNGPRLELLRLRIEPHDRVWLHGRFAVPDDVVNRRDAVRLRLRPARRR